MSDWDCPYCGNDPEDCDGDCRPCETPGCCGAGVCEICTCCTRGHCSFEHVVVGGSVHADGNEAAWQQVGHVGHDVAAYATQANLYAQAPHLVVDGVAAAALQYADSVFMRSRLQLWGEGDDQRQPVHADLDMTRYGFDWSGIGHAPQSNLTVEVVNPEQFDLFMYGRSRAAHQLLQRLNTRWKYRISPGVPERVRRVLGGDPELQVTPVIVEFDGRKVEALAERGYDTVKLYPAHPKGQNPK